MASKPILADTFADSVIDTRGPRWTKPTRYWPTLMWNSGTTDPTGFAIAPDESELHDKYLAGFGMAAMRVYPTPGVPRLAACYTHRLSQAEDQIVKATFKMVDLRGASGFYTDGLWAGVGARITGEVGTEFNSGSGYSEMLTAPSGYYFLLMNKRPAAVAILGFAIIKVIGPGTAGGVSTVTELASFTHSSVTQDELGHLETFGMRYSCITNGGVVEHRGYFTDKGGVETLLISHDEGTGSLTESGHACLVSTTEMRTVGNTLAGAQWVMGIVDFEIQDSSSTVVMRDEWDRVNLHAARKAGDDAFFSTGWAAYDGQLISGMYTGDQSGEDGAGELPLFSERLLRHASVNKLEVDDTPVGGFHFFYQPPSNIYTQSVSIDVDFAAGGSTGTRYAGVLLRRSLGEADDWSAIVGGQAGSTGYSVYVRYVSWTGVFNLFLNRYWNGAYVVFAHRILNLSGDPVTLVVGTKFTLRVDIENLDGPSASSGNVHLIPKIDGNLLTDNWTLSSQGVREEPDGSITDFHGARILSGGSTGFLAKTDLAGETVYIENATQIDTSVVVTETEQASVAIPAEIDGATGTFTVPHEWPVETVFQAYDVAHDLDSAQTHRHSKASAQRRVWNIHSDAAKASEVSDLDDFFVARDGVDIPFNWTTPDGEAVVVLFVEDSLVTRKINKAAYEFSVSLMEMVN